MPRRQMRYWASRKPAPRSVFDGDAHSAHLRRRAGQRDEGAPHIGGTGRRDDIRHVAGRHDLAAMQHDHRIVGRDLVEQMGRPQHGNAALAHQRANMAQDGGARRDVQPDRRFVQHQDARPVQQRACDLDPAHLSARQPAHRLLGAVRQIDLLQCGERALPRLATADAVQRGVIEQVLHHRQIEIERARLEHHAQQAQCPARLARHTMTQHLDRAVPRVVEPRDQREQRGLAGAVQAEQRGEARLRHGQADVLQRLARSVGVADVAHSERRHGRCRARRGARREIGDAVGAHFGDTTTPQGSRPTWIDFTTSSDGDIDHRDVVGKPIGGQQVFLVRRECHLPDALADQQQLLHLVCLRVDHRDAVGRAQRHECGRVIAG